MDDFDAAADAADDEVFQSSTLDVISHISRHTFTADGLNRVSSRHAYSKLKQSSSL